MVLWYNLYISMGLYVLLVVYTIFLAGVLGVLCTSFNILSIDSDESIFFLVIIRASFNIRCLSFSRFSGRRPSLCMRYISSTKNVFPATYILLLITVLFVSTLRYVTPFLRVSITSYPNSFGRINAISKIPPKLNGSIRFLDGEYQRVFRSSANSSTSINTFLFTGMLLVPPLVFLIKVYLLVTYGPDLENFNPINFPILPLFDSTRLCIRVLKRFDISPSLFHNKSLIAWSLPKYLSSGFIRGANFVSISLVIILSSRSMYILN